MNDADLDDRPLRDRADAHGPKTAALLAHAEGLLSAAGTARLERHLDACQVCRRELASIRAYEQVSAEARAVDSAPVDFERIGRRLEQEAQRISRDVAVRKRRAAMVWSGLALAAAAAVALVVTRFDAGSSSSATGPRGVPARLLGSPAGTRDEPGAATVGAPLATADAALSATVTLVGGAARVASANGTAEGSRTERPAVLGSTLAEGEAIRTGADGTVHARLSAGTGIVIAPSSDVRLVEARTRSVRLEVVEGTVHNEVAHLSEGSRYVVEGAGHRVEVRGTRFAVSVRDGRCSVDLEEGSVVIDAPGAQRVTLRAPARWTASGPMPGAPEVARARELAVGGGPANGDAAAELGWVPVALAAPGIARWQLDGTEIASPTVGLRVRPGDHEVRGWDSAGRLHVAQITAIEAPLRLDQASLTRAEDSARVRAGHLAPEEIARVVERGRRQLTACYERGLRHNPELAGRIRLRVTVSASGDVQRVGFSGADQATSETLRECVSASVRGWTFPPPGGPVTFEAPIAFAPRGR